MAQQFHNGGGHGGDLPGNVSGSTTVSIRDCKRYAVVNPKGQGKHQRLRPHTAIKDKSMYWTEEQKKCFGFYNFIRKRFRRIV